MLTVRRKGGGLARLAAALPKVAQQEVDAAAERIAGEARGLVPVKRGSLKGSIETHPAGVHAAVVQAGGGGHTTPEGKPVDYALPVEMGGAGRPAKPFMRPAAFAEAPRFPKELAKALREAMR